MIDFNDKLLKYADGTIFSMDRNYDIKRNTVLIWAACHGRGILDKLKEHHSGKYNFLRLETGPVLKLHREQRDPFNNQAIKDIFHSADYIVTYNMGARHGVISLDSIRPLIRSDSKIITFTAPNCSCFWPVSYGYTGGVPVYDALDSGHTFDSIWQDFKAGKFNPMFNIRFRLELGRLEDKDSYHDIKLAKFVLDHFKTHKLWMAHSHPSGILFAFIASGISMHLGLDGIEMDSILSTNPSLYAMGATPETDYEFKHFQFTYNMNFIDAAKMLQTYKPIFQAYHDAWKCGKMIPPIWD